MKINNSSFTLYFPENKNIRENIFILEQHFADFQHPFTLVTLPLDAPPEIPRILATTKNGHSRLTICGNSVQLMTRYDNDYIHSIKKCLNYTIDKIQKIIEYMPLIIGVPEGIHKCYYSGLSMDLAYTKEDGIENPIEYIKKIHIKDNISLQIDEMQYRLALVIDSQYYVNIILQNQKTFNGVPDERGSLAGLEKKEDTLLVSLDINDRYAFNNTMSYSSSKESMMQLATIMEQFVENYLPAFINTGEIVYGTE